jgi:hypothetical protein
MSRVLFIASTMLLAVFVASADAAVFERDWKTPGDGLLTVDNVNQREWLDLSQTLLTSQFPGSDREARFQYVVNQTGPEGLFEGFSVAKSPDVLALAQSAGIDTSSQDYAINYTLTFALQDLLSVTLGPGTGNSNTFSIGLLDENGGMPPPFRLGAIFRITFTSRAGLIFDDPMQFLQTTAPPGVMLFRSAIPEPAYSWLALLSIPVLFARCRRFFRSSA